MAGILIPKLSDPHIYWVMQTFSSNIFPQLTYFFFFLEYQQAFLVVVWQIFPGEKSKHICLLIPDKERSIPKIYQCKDTTKVQLGEMVNYLGVIFRNIDEVLHIGAEMTQGQLHHRRPPKYGRHSTGNLEHIAHGTGSSRGRRLSFPDASVDLSLV